MSSSLQADLSWTDSPPRGWSIHRIKSLFHDDTENISVSQLVDLDVDHYSIPSFDELGAPAREQGSTIASNKRLLRGGELLFSKLNSHKPRIWLVPQNDGIKVASTEFIALREWHDRAVCKGFITYLLGSASFTDYIRCFQKSVTNSHKRISPEALWQTSIPLPPLPEQERIAAYLDASCAAIDAAVDIKRRQLETLDGLRKSTAHKILTEGLRPRRSLKDSGIESFGMIPDHWIVQQIRHACAVSYGITLQLEKGQVESDGVRILTVSNVTIDGALDLTDKYYINPTELTHNDYLRCGDLLFNWRNGSQYHVGKTAFFNLDGEFAHVSFLLRIRCGPRLNPFFLRSYLGVLKDAGFFSGSKDKVNKTFNSTELKRLRVVIPSIDEQDDICRELQRHTKQINSVKTCIERQIETLTAYRKSLIHECVTGQRRISEADVRRVCQDSGLDQELLAEAGV